MTLVDSNFALLCPRDDDWDIVKKVYKFLSVFNKITNTFSKSTYLTSNLYFSAVTITHLILGDKLDDVDDFIRSMTLMLYEKYKKY